MILRHRDRELLRFEWIGAHGVRVLSVNDAERKFLPIEMAGTVSDEMRSRLKKLIGFRFTPHHTHNLSVRRLRKIESFLQKRGLGIIEYGNKADDLLQLSTNGGTINLDHGHDSLLAAIIENIRADSYVTQEELCDILKVTRSVLTKAMAQLQAEGKLLRRGSRKTGYWQVKD